MGRTIPTFNMQLEEEVQSWRPFRAALRKEDQACFDDLFIKVKRHMAEGQNAGRALAIETILMCIALELSKEIRALAARVDHDGDAH